MPAISENIAVDTADVEENASATINTNGSGGGLNAGQFTATKDKRIGLRYTAIGPSAGDTIDDANLLFSVVAEALTNAAEDVYIYVDTASGALWGASDRPSQITFSTAFAIVEGNIGTGDNKSIDITAVLQERVDDASYDGDVRFTWEDGTDNLENWDYVRISDYGSAAGTPESAVLEGNYTSSGGATFVPKVMIY
jgi:hypothetical protein